MAGAGSACRSAMQAKRNTVASHPQAMLLLLISMRWALCEAKPSRVFFDSYGSLLRTNAAPANTKLYLPMYKGEVLLQRQESSWRSAMLTESQAHDWASEEGCITARVAVGAPGAALTEYAASLESKASRAPSFWLLDLSHLAEPPPADTFGLPHEAEWRPLRSGAGLSVLDNLHDDDEGALLATARGLALWHRSHGFCSLCGGATVSKRKGAIRECERCGTRHRPRLDPCVIVLVTDGDERCLLGRKAAWPKGRYSCLSGFLDFGETLEECVVREVAEESGVAVDRQSIRYVASHPWLFPRSMMIGFIAQADNADLGGMDDELDDVRWFSRAEVAECIDKSEEHFSCIHRTRPGFPCSQQMSSASSGCVYEYSSGLDSVSLPRYSHLRKVNSGVAVPVALAPTFPHHSAIDLMVRLFACMESANDDGILHIPSRVSLANTIIRRWLDKSA